ncbi:MAG: PDZ domain-containing protein [Bdellovibrio sp.]|nr:PDZ domain-containing protein [Bdellovibrio sp.]
MKHFKTALILLFGYSCLSLASAGTQTVRDVAPGSRFEQIGLKPDDKIISYDNHEVKSVEDSMEMYNKLRNDEINYLVVERDGQSVVVAAKSQGVVAPPPPMEYYGPKKLKKTSRSYSEPQQ